MTKKSRGVAPFLDTTDWTEAQIDGLLSSAPKDHWATFMLVALTVIGIPFAVLVLP